ncbi:MAG TPA: bifunctional diguanylate cyclase/phosphodiesterase, partial [Telluria sp.]|nr:bifunctional diguanylate cyclase/phosphodiesterase [Telluria sp.]
VLGTLDRFSGVVSGFGHAFGDQMLKSMALRIERAAQPHGGEVFRLDGANFAVLYRLAQADPAFGAAIAGLQERMRTPFSCENHEVFSSLSLGAASFPQDGARPAALLRNADAALQAARRAGGDRLSAYSQELNAEAEKRLELETGLRHALARGELELHYQPQQTLASGALLGFEALLRWRHKGAPVAPADFIPLAEESGLIVAIGEWVLEQACRQLAAWNAGVTPPLSMAVNISPRQFSHPDFFAGVERVLAATGVDPRWVELEITEGVMMENAETAIALLGRLRRLGLQLAIDDFGTGYSSLAYLKRFPIHKLKIDQSFVRQLEAGSEDVAIVQAVISLGHTLGLTVIAEGVETDEQRALLRAWCCDQIQGYCYGRPLAAGAARAFIAAEPERSAAAKLAPYRKLRRSRGSGDAAA